MEGTTKTKERHTKSLLTSSFSNRLVKYLTPSGLKNHSLAKMNTFVVWWLDAAVVTIVREAAMEVEGPLRCIDGVSDILMSAM